MKNLSIREQKLLTMLVTLILAIVLVAYFVMPAKDKNNQLNNENQELLAQKIEMDAQIAKRDQLIEDKDELTEEVDRLMEAMGEEITGENFDLLVQNLAKNNGAKIKSIQYGETSVIAPSAHGTPVEQYEYNLKELVDAYLGHESSETESFDTEHEVLKKPVTLEVTGSYLTLQKMVSDLNNIGKTYYVHSLTYNRSESEKTSDDSDYVETVVDETARVEIDVYFLKTDDSISNKLPGQKG